MGTSDAVRPCVRISNKPNRNRGEGKLAIRDLEINSHRMRPDRFVVGALSSLKTLDMYQAMNTGHDRSVTTVMRIQQG